jgi:type IV pilus assembly protein PilB
MTKELEKIVVGEFTEADIIKEADRQGMITMRQDGFLKAAQGLVSLEEVLQVVEE